MAKTVQVGSTQFKVDLEQFEHAITTVTNSTNAISQDFSEIQASFKQVEASWHGPAGDTYQTVQSALSSATGQMISVLRDIILRMQNTYENYVQMEEANTRNVS